MFQSVIQDPDYIFRDKNPNTAIASKYFPEIHKHINLAIRLVVEGDPPDYKNSVITAVGEGERRFEQRLRNCIIIFKNVDKNE